MAIVPIPNAIIYGDLKPFVEALQICAPGANARVIAYRHTEERVEPGQNGMLAVIYQMERDLFDLAFSMGEWSAEAGTVIQQEFEAAKKLVDDSEVYHRSNFEYDGQHYHVMYWPHVIVTEVVNAAR